MKSWKTTLLGICTILAAVAVAGKTWLASGVLPDLSPIVTALTAGVGLIVARDNSVTSEQAGAK